MTLRVVVEVAVSVEVIIETKLVVSVNVAVVDLMKVVVCFCEVKR